MEISGENKDGYQDAALDQVGGLFEKVGAGDNRDGITLRGDRRPPKRRPRLKQSPTPRMNDFPQLCQRSIGTEDEEQKFRRSAQTSARLRALSLPNRYANKCLAETEGRTSAA